MDIKLSGKNVVIKIPIDLLVDAFNYKDDIHGWYQVKYKRKFAEGVVKYLQGYSRDSETGLTAFQELLDEIFDEMIANAEDYIKELITVDEFE